MAQLEPTHAEFILRVRVPIKNAENAESLLKVVADRLRARLSRIETAQRGDGYALHVRRKKLR